jgi:signal transduction histidine kinase
MPRLLSRGKIGGILISTKCEADSVVTSVRDYGGGLPKDNPDKIFTHFYSTKPNWDGDGSDHCLLDRGIARG